MSPCETVYVVTYGKYSDYCIGAVFHDKADAEALVKKRRYTSARVEEWELHAATDGCKVCDRVRAIREA